MKMALRAALLALVVSALGGLGGPVAQAAETATGPAAACAPAPAGAQRMAASGGVQAWWLPAPAPLRVGQPFALLIGLCPAQAQLLRVDAQMPEHRHGMNYKPTLQALGAGRWRAEGLLWHMPGRWELTLDTRLAEHKVPLAHSVTLR